MTKRLIRILGLTYLVIGVLVALIVLATKDSANVDSNSSTHVVTPYSDCEESHRITPICHVFSESIVRICAPSAKGSRFEVPYGKVRGIRERPGCIEYEAPATEVKLQGAVSFVVDEKVVDTIHFPIVPDCGFGDPCKF